MKVVDNVQRRIPCVLEISRETAVAQTSWLIRELSYYHFEWFHSATSFPFDQNQPGPPD